MGKYLWVVGALAFAGTLAYAGWERSAAQRAEPERSLSSAARVTDALEEVDSGTSQSRETQVARVSNRSVSAAAISRQSGAAEAASDESGRAQIAVSREVSPDVAASVSTAPAAHETEQALEDSTEVDPRWEAAVRLPDPITKLLDGTGSPHDQEILQRNRQLQKPGKEDVWGMEMQGRLTEFLAPRAERAGLKTSVACRESQCQLQFVGLAPVPQRAAGTISPTDVMFMELNREWWYRGQMVSVMSVATVVDNRAYHLQYFDRKK